MFYRDGYGWCWEADHRGGNHVWRADPWPASIGCSRVSRPVVYEPMLVPEDLVFIFYGSILLFLSCFISCLGTNGCHSGMGQSDVVFSFEVLASRVSRFPKGEVMLCIFDHRGTWDTTYSYRVLVH